MRAGRSRTRVGLTLLGVLALVAWPAAASAQTGAVVEYYHLDAPAFDPASLHQAAGSGHPERSRRVGSVRVVTDASVNVVRRHDYLPFGEEWNGTPGVLSPKMFTGHERDVQTALDYFAARHYRSDLGRFTTPDAPGADQNPADPQSWNLYGCARYNPLRFDDPTGGWNRDVHERLTEVLALAVGFRPACWGMRQR